MASEGEQPLPAPEGDVKPPQEEEGKLTRPRTDGAPEGAPQKSARPEAVPLETLRIKIGDRIEVSWHVESERRGFEASFPILSQLLARGE